MRTLRITISAESLNSQYKYTQLETRESRAENSLEGGPYPISMIIFRIGRCHQIILTMPALQVSA